MPPKLIEPAKLEAFCKLLERGETVENAKTRADVSPMLLTSWLASPKVAERIGASQRRVAPPRDADKPTDTLRSKVENVQFYEFLTSKDFCGLDVSPAIRAVSLAADARPDEIGDDALCMRLFGCPASGLPRVRPRVVVVRSGGQCGKTSRLGAPKVLHGAITTPLPNVLPGQWARGLITAPSVDLATAALDYCRGFIFNSPALRSMLVDEIAEDDDEEDVGTAERIGLKRPDGVLVELRVKAANRGGMGGRSRSLPAALMDEVCFFLGSDYRINDDEIFGAIELRVVPEGQTWLVSSPNIEGYGLLEKFVADEWGKHETALVALASTRLFFPGWDPDRKIETPLRKRDPDKARREIDGLPLEAGESAFYSPVVLRMAEVKPPTVARMLRRGAGGDYAFVRNSSTLVIAESYEDGTYAIVDVDEQVPQHGQPLRPSLVCATHARKLMSYDLGVVMIDGHYREAIREHFGKWRALCPACGALVVPRVPLGNTICVNEGNFTTVLGEGCGYGSTFDWRPKRVYISIAAGPEGRAAADPFKALREHLAEGRVRLPAHPRLLSQLRAVKGEPRPGVGQDYRISQPEQRNAGPGGTMAHGDIVSAAVLALRAVGMGAPLPAAPLWMPVARSGRRCA